MGSMRATLMRVNLSDSQDWQAFSSLKNCTAQSSCAYFSSFGLVPTDSNPCQYQK